MATRTAPQTTTPVAFPHEVKEYIESKVQTNGSGGRPHFFQTISDLFDPKDVLLEILDRSWLRNKSIGSTAKKYGTKYLTIYRILQDLTPFKEALVQYLRVTPRRKVFFNRSQETSDYETVQTYIRRAKRDGVRTWKRKVTESAKVWTFLKYKDPARWTAEDVHDYLSTLTEGNQSGLLDSIRKVAPQIADKKSPHYIGTGKFREKLRLRKKDLFGQDIVQVVHALYESGLTYHATILKLHITLGAREGSHSTNAGMTGITWDRFKKNFTRVDLYESKVRGGIWWRNCPVDLFWKTLPQELREIWVNREKPITEPLLMGGYSELLRMYHEMRSALKTYFEGKLEPSLFKEVTTLKPHDSDKIHCNLLWEADVKLEVVAGQYLGRGEGVGLMGRGWLDINTIKKHYLSLTQRSEKFQQTMNKVQEYSLRFNGGH